MKKTIITAAVVCILLFFYLSLNAKTSHRILGVLQAQVSESPQFYIEKSADDVTVGERLVAQLVTQTQRMLGLPQTQSQSQTQTQMQTQRQTQSQSQTQTQTLYIGFPMQLTWKFKAESPLIAQPQTDSTSVYCVTKSGVSHRVDQKDGNELWKLNLGDVVEEGILLKDKVLYVATQNGLIFAIDAGKGKQIWRQKVEGENFSTMPSADDKNLYLLSVAGTAISLDRKSGNIIWRFKALGECLTTPFLSGKELIFGCNDKNLYVIDTSAGFVKWKFMADAQIMGSPVASDTDVFFGDEQGKFYRISKGTHGQVWKYKSGASIRGIPMLYFDEKKRRLEDVFFSSLDNFLYSLKIKDGERNWLSGTVARVFNRMHFDRALIFMTPFGSNVFGFDPHSGKRVGEYDAGARIRSSPNTTNDRLFVGLNDGKLLCLTRQPPPPPEGEGVQTQTQTQTQTQMQTQTQTQTQSQVQTVQSETQTSQSQTSAMQTQSQTQSQ
jgi:eukaryotic-like serine/threonine-protein kinase